MMSRHSGTIVSNGPSTFAVADVEAMTDGDLLARFLNRGASEAEAAFEALVRRHGPMVLGVCRHVLERAAGRRGRLPGHVPPARPQGRVDPRSRGAGPTGSTRWPIRTAVRAKANAARRNARERQGAAMLATGHDHDVAWNELRPVLHEEIGRLPEKYRTPVVLCYLEGKTNEEVAALLDWPVGTVKGRLSRRRDLLRSRLTRRGLTLSAGLLATLFSQNAVLAEVVPTRLVESTVDSAMRVAAGEVGAVSSDVAALLESAADPRSLGPPGPARRARARPGGRDGGERPGQGAERQDHRPERRTGVVQRRSRGGGMPRRAHAGNPTQRPLNPGELSRLLPMVARTPRRSRKTLPPRQIEAVARATAFVVARRPTGSLTGVESGRVGSDPFDRPVAGNVQ